MSQPIITEEDVLNTSEKSVGRDIPRSHSFEEDNFVIDPSPKFDNGCQLNKVSIENCSRAFRTENDIGGNLCTDVDRLHNISTYSLCPYESGSIGYNYQDSDKYQDSNKFQGSNLDLIDLNPSNSIEKKESNEMCSLGRLSTFSKYKEVTDKPVFSKHISAPNCRIEIDNKSDDLIEMEETKRSTKHLIEMEETKGSTTIPRSNEKTGKNLDFLYSVHTLTQFQPATLEKIHEVFFKESQKIFEKKLSIDAIRIQFYEILIKKYNELSSHNPSLPSSETFTQRVYHKREEITNMLILSNYQQTPLAKFERVVEKEKR